MDSCDSGETTHVSPRCVNQSTHLHFSPDPDELHCTGMAFTALSRSLHTCGKLYIAPSVKLQLMPSMELNPSVTICARRRSELSSELRSDTQVSYDASPGFGGFIKIDIATWPIVLGLRLILAHLYTSSIVPGWMFVISTYPPRRPHSPPVPCMPIHAMTSGHSEEHA